MNRAFRSLRSTMTAATVLTALLAVASSPAMSAVAAEPVTLHADVIDATGQPIGTVVLQQMPTGVLVTADVKGLPPGDHGFHFHEKGVCDPAQKFATAGGHFAGMGREHGLMAMDPHGGDMPNQHVGADGTLATQVLNTGVTLTAGSRSLVDADGTALIIHANADDYTSQPAGNAGGRIACAVVLPPR